MTMYTLSSLLYARRSEQRLSTWLMTLTLGLAACTGQSPIQDGPPPQPRDLSDIQDAIPRAEPLSKYGNPPYYEVNGRRYYVMKSRVGYQARGIASWYGTEFHGRRTSSGEIYDMYGMTAAHTALPLPTYVQVTNLQNGRQVIVRVNDRGPFKKNRILDLSYAAAVKLGIAEAGTGLVEVRALEAYAPKPLKGATALSGRQRQDKPSRLFLQVGAFIDQDNARRLEARLRQHGVTPVVVHRGYNQQQIVYRVRLGPLDSIAEADHLTDHLLALGITDPQVVVD
jgi:rare lipoprotein A